MNYQRSEIIGKGGMSTVYRGVALEGAPVAPGTPVALKYFNSEEMGNSTLMERFFQEVRITHAIQSPYIARSYDIEFDGQIPVIVMELLRGKSLRLQLKESGTLPEKEVLRIALAVSRGLEAAHKLVHALGRGVVHRDIKPGNIHLGHNWLSDLSSIKILDFGIARVHNSELTRISTQLGTCQYMSPEQFRAEGEILAQADFYSLGIVMWEMLMGSLPYDGSTIELMRQHTSAQDPPILPAQFHTKTRSLVREMMEKDQRRRRGEADYWQVRIQNALDALQPPAPKDVVIPTPAAQNPIARQPFHAELESKGTIVSGPSCNGVKISKSPKSNPPWPLLMGAGAFMLLLMAVFSSQWANTQSATAPEGTEIPFLVPAGTPEAEFFIEPTAQPTEEPTPFVPTPEPTLAPTLAPVPTIVPLPTKVIEPTPLPLPTAIPTSRPTPVPTAVPTPIPTRRPAPTPRPTSRPRPTPRPTAVPQITTSVETRTQRISASSVRRPSSNLYRGQTRVVSRPVAGLREIRTRVTRRDGRIVEREVLSREVVRTPVNGIIEYGTRPRGGGSGGGQTPSSPPSPW